MSFIPLDKFENWLKAKNLKERTIREYIYYFNKFTYEMFNQESVARFLSDKGHRNAVSRGFLINFKKFLMINYKDLGLSEYYRTEIINTELPKLTGRNRKVVKRPIPHDKIKLLEEALDSEKNKLRLLLTYYCGLRLGELFKINILSFNWDKWKQDTSQMGEVIVHGKGDQEGIALVPAFLMKRITKYIKDNEFDSLSAKIFGTGRLDDIPIKNAGRSWQKIIKKAGIDSGITKLDSEGKVIPDTSVHPHKLRHSYAHHLLWDLRIDIRKVQELLRHRSIQSTQIYTHVDKEKLKDEIKDSLVE